jgi:hypothetical protein
MLIKTWQAGDADRLKLAIHLADLLDGAFSRTKQRRRRPA